LFDQLASKKNKKPVQEVPIGHLIDWQQKQKREYVQEVPINFFASSM